MALTGIGDARTPGRPVEVTFGNTAGQPSATQTVTLIGHAASGAGSGTAAAYVVSTVSNSGDPVAAKTEAEAKFGVGSELAKMVVAAVNANFAVGRSQFPQLKAVPLRSTDADFGAADVALTALNKAGECEFIVSPYDATSATLLTKLKTQAAGMSAAGNVANNQFGTFGVAVNRSVTDPATLTTADSQFLILGWLRDTGTAGNAPAYSLGELAAAFTAYMAGNAIPFNPIDNDSIGAVVAPVQMSDWITVGDNAESETALQKGWNPLRVKANGDVAFVRSITSRLSADGTGTPVVTSYFDVQDFQVLYYWRKTEYTRLTQPDMTHIKASVGAAVTIKAEIIRLMQSFEDQNMFQAVAQLAKQVVVQRTATDRSAFECLVPVNVIPGLHRVKSNVQATTQFDSVTV